jgi:hypothetical protein
VIGRNSGNRPGTSDARPAGLRRRALSAWRRFRARRFPARSRQYAAPVRKGSAPLEFQIAIDCLSCGNRQRAWRAQCPHVRQQRLSRAFVPQVPGIAALAESTRLSNCCRNLVVVS